MGILIPTVGLLPALLVAMAVAVFGIARQIRRWTGVRTLPFFCIAVFGGDVAVGIEVGAVNLPLAYALVGMSLLVMAVFGRRPPLRKVERRLVVALTTWVSVALLVGVVNGYEGDLIREEVLLGVVLIGSFLLWRGASWEAVSGSLLACGLLAAVKTLLIALVLRPSANGQLFHTNVMTSQAFGVTRVMPIGGDILMAVAFPIATARVLGASRGHRWSSAIAGAVVAMGLIVTFTRGLIGAALLGSFVAVLLAIKEIGPARRRTRSVGVVVAAAVVLVLLGNMGIDSQSGYSANEALARRVQGGTEIGSSALSTRTDEANAALRTMTGISWLAGKGAGSTYHSTIPGVGETNYVHIGYAWLMLKVGLFGFVLMIGAQVQAMRRLAVASSREGFLGAPTHATHASALVAAIAGFLAVNLLLNQFASPSGVMVLGALLGASMTSMAHGGRLMDGLASPSAIVLAQ